MSNQPKLILYPKYDVGQVVKCVATKDVGVAHWFRKGWEGKITSFRYGTIWKRDPDRFIFRLNKVFELDEGQLDRNFKIIKTKRKSCISRR